MSYVTGINLGATDDDPEFKPGQIGQTYDGKLYKYLQYAEGTAATAGVTGEVAYYVSATGYAANQVTSDLSDSDEVGAGVLQADLTDLQYGWFQIKGLATLSIAFTAGADGDPMTATGATDGTLDVSAAVTDVVVGVAGDASSNELLCDFPM